MHKTKILQKTRPKKKRTRAAHAARPKEMVNRSINFMPTAMRTTLRYQKTINFNNTGVNHANIRFAPSYLYDVDPVLGSTSMAGFAELTAIYRYYRFRSCRWRITAASDDTAPSVLCVCPVNFDPGVNTANFQNYLAARRAKITTLTSQMVRSLRGSMSVADIGGVLEVLLPDAYSGTSTTSPANNIWLFIGTSCPGTMTNGITISIVMDITADYFELAQPATFFRGATGLYKLDPSKDQVNAMINKINDLNPLTSSEQ